MATLVMPLVNDLPAYKFQITLEAKIYTFEFRYNERMDRWLMGHTRRARKPATAGVSSYSPTIA